MRFIGANGNIVCEGLTTSGKGKHWNTQSRFSDNFTIYLLEDKEIGVYNVRLTPGAYNGPRHSFYIHEGYYPASAECVEFRQ